MKKLGKVSLICLLAILLVGCQSTERYLKFRDDLDAKLTRALKIVPDSIRDMEKGDAILCEADMILLDYLIEICGMIIDLAPSKEMVCTTLRFRHPITQKPPSQTAPQYIL